MAYDLTPRQTEVVRLLSLGCAVHEIAEILGIASSTVDNHKSAAMESLGARNKAILTRLAIKHRISPLRDRLTRTEKRKCGYKNDGWN